MKIEILGTSFMVQSDQDPAYLREIVDYYTSRVADIEKSVTTSDPLKLSILAALLITDELFKQKSNGLGTSQRDALEASTIAQNLLRELDDMLKSAEFPESTRS